MSCISRFHLNFRPIFSEMFELPKGFPWTQKLSTLEGALVRLAAPFSSFSIFLFYF